MTSLRLRGAALQIQGGVNNNLSANPSSGPPGLPLTPRYNFNVDNGPVRVEWFPGAETNVCYNCVDRHVEAGLGDRVAFLWEGNDEGQERTVTFKELQEMVGRLWVQRGGC